MSNLPKFLCIGVQKAATSWLWVQLRSHQDVWMPPVKELHYFDHLYVPDNRNWTGWHIRKHVGASVKWHEQNGKTKGSQLKYLNSLLADDMFTEAWYRRAYDSPGARGRITGDVTPEYCMIPEEGIGYVEKLLGRVKIIVNIRDPISRALSQIRMNAQRRGVSLDNATKEEWQAYAEDPVIRSRARYSVFPEQWTRIFGHENFHVIEHEDVSTNPALVMKRLEDFLGLRRSVYKKAAERVHQGMSLASPAPDEVVSYLQSALESDIVAYRGLKAKSAAMP